MMTFYADIYDNLRDIRYILSPIIIQHSKDEIIIDLLLKLDKELLELKQSAKLYDDGSIRTIVPNFANLFNLLSLLSNNISHRLHEDDPNFIMAPNKQQYA